jgi:hypothetical protein
MNGIGVGPAHLRNHDHPGFAGQAKSNIFRVLGSMKARRERRRFGAGPEGREFPAARGPAPDGAISLDRRISLALAHRF